MNAEIVSSAKAAEEIAQQATIAVLRSEYNALMREHPKYLLFLLALVNSENEKTAMVAIEAVHNLLWPFRGQPIVNQLEINQDYSMTADRMQVCGLFLCLDKVWLMTGHKWDKCMHDSRTCEV